MQENFPGVVVILVNEKRDLFILQKKDNSHPIVGARGKLSIIGGSLEQGETPLQALGRELFEEIDNMQVVDSILKNCVFWKDFTLPRAEFGPGKYLCTVFVAVGDMPTFAFWADEIYAKDGLNEGTAELHSPLIIQFGKFICSLDMVMQDFVQNY